MSEITEIASAVSQMRQDQVKDQAGMRVLKMALKAEKDIARMLLENIDNMQESPDSTESHIDIYV